MRLGIVCVTFIISALSEISFAQQKIVHKDSTRLYEHIESYSKQRKLTKLIYPLVFKSLSDSSKNGAKNNSYHKLITKNYKPYEGKIIRDIHIKTLDPFGYSMIDTLTKPNNFLHKSGNRLHVKSRQITIRNLLIIKKNQVFDSLLVKESERLIRSRGFVRDVSFEIMHTSKNSDSVDIFIREFDNWSILPEFGASVSQVSVKLTDKNFMGLGHEFQNASTWFHNTGNYAHNINYFISNIRNTYINSTLHYGQDEFGNYVRIFSIDRPFFSPFAKWAAGLSYVQQFRNDSVITPNLVYIPQALNFDAQDYWVGTAIQIHKGNTEYRRTTNFIATIRFANIRYNEKSREFLDPLQIYNDENLYLAGIGISTRKYVQDKYIFKFGVVEDVPIGKAYGIIAGFQNKINTNRLYLGVRYSLGNYYQWGYLSSNFEYGTFFHQSKTEQSAFTASLIYFTGLIELGKWKFRQFIKPQLTIGYNRPQSDSLTINDGYGLEGFNSRLLSGTQRFLLTSQTQSYAPFKLLGFSFGPYLDFSIGMLGNNVDGFRKSKVYSQIGFGLLIKNENLVLNTFQVSISFYPLIPGQGNNVFKFNSYRTSDFKLKDFEIGKPSVLVFQ